MPHIILEYSDNLLDTPDLQAFWAKLHPALVATAGCRPQDIKSRAYRAEPFRMGDGAPANAFAHLTIRLLAGRDAEARARIGQAALGLLAETFPRTLAGISAAQRAGFTTVEAITCVRPANLWQLAAIERTVRDAGASLYRLITIDRMGRLAGCEAPEMWLEPAGVRTLLDHVERRRAEGADVRFSCGGFLGLDREGAVRPEHGQCYAGACIASILCDGQVGACPSIPRQWAAQGSVLEHRFSTIWRDRFEKYRDLGWRKGGACEGCSWFDTCLGGGLHERLVQPEEFCWLDRQG